MKKTERCLVVASLIVLLAICTPIMAHADWGFRMGDDGFSPSGTHYNFKKIEFFLDHPGNPSVTWSGQGVTNFSNTSWTANKVNPTYVLATGPAINYPNSLYWNVLFAGTAPTGTFYLDYLVYAQNKNKPVYGISLKIVNGVWDPYAPGSWTALDLKNLPNYNRNPVPLPPSVWLLGAGLVGAFVMRRRMTRPK